MNEKVLNSALALWGLLDVPAELIACRENHIYKVFGKDGTPYALRVHRLNYCSLDELNSELQWMALLAKNRISVPAPLLSTEQRLIEVIEGWNVDVLSWLDGVPLGKNSEPLVLNSRAEVFRMLGKAMAQLHSVSDDWDLPEKFTRRHWDTKGLLGSAPIWNRFWENPRLSNQDAKMITQARSLVIKKMQDEIEGQLDFGLIHADMVRENILIAQGQIQIIDFDDSGFGYRLFDVVTALIKNQQEVDYVELKNAFFNGYRAIRPLDVKHLELFMLLRSWTYLGWVISRMNEVGSSGRCERFVQDAIYRTKRFMDGEF